MRPLELELSGFGPYRNPQTIDFSQVHLACITGPNGAGKSTILDAINFVLFGLTRAGTIDQVVNSQVDEASVTLVFEHQGERWKANRTRVRGKRSDASLAREVDGTWEALRLSGVPGFAAEISRMIRVSSKTFAATVLLAQNGAGRFARAEAPDRKRILSEILGLDRYKVLAEAAKVEHTHSTLLHREQQALIDAIDVRLMGSHEAECELAAAEARLCIMDGEISDAESQVEKLTRDRSALDVSRTQLQSLQDQIRDTEEGSRRRVAEARHALGDAEARAQRAFVALDATQQRLAEILATEASLHELSEAENGARAEVARLGDLEQTILESGQAAKTTVAGAMSEITSLGEILETTRQRLRSLSHDGAECFTCGQSLPKDRRLNLISEAEQEIRALEQTIVEANRRRETSESMRLHLRSELEIVRVEKKAAQLVLEQNGAALAAARHACTARSQTETELTRAVEQHDFCAQEINAALASVAKLEDDPTLSALQAKASTLREQLRAMENTDVRYAAAVGRVRELVGERTSLIRVDASLRERLAGFASLREERAERLAAAMAAARNMEDYAQLMKAFGPDGVPNLIFAGAAAELERDVSEITQRLTEGKYRLEFRTEKSNKGQETVEALDVVAVSSTGEHSYAALSGGEQFRVDLAVQIGLTRLLVRRSGSPIDFLAIDEGWGSLDPDGISAMLSVLREAGEEFPLVLTITHTPEVAVAFQTRYEVLPEPDGNSFVSLVAS